MFNVIDLTLDHENILDYQNYLTKASNKTYSYFLKSNQRIQFPMDWK